MDYYSLFHHLQRTQYVSVFHGYKQLWRHVKIGYVFPYTYWVVIQNIYGCPWNRVVSTCFICFILDIGACFLATIYSNFNISDSVRCYYKFLILYYAYYSYYGHVLWCRHLFTNVSCWWAQPGGCISSSRNVWLWWYLSLAFRASVPVPVLSLAHYFCN